MRTRLVANLHLLAAGIELLACKAIIANGSSCFLTEIQTCSTAQPFQFQLAAFMIFCWPAREPDLACLRRRSLAADLLAPATGRLKCQGVQLSQAPVTHFSCTSGR